MQVPSATVKLVPPLVSLQAEKRCKGAAEHCEAPVAWYALAQLPVKPVKCPSCSQLLPAATPPWFDACHVTYHPRAWQVI